MRYNLIIIMIIEEAKTKIINVMQEALDYYLKCPITTTPLFLCFLTMISSNVIFIGKFTPNELHLYRRLLNHYLLPTAREFNVYKLSPVVWLSSSSDTSYTTNSFRVMCLQLLILIAKDGGIEHVYNHPKYRSQNSLYLT